MRVCIPAGGSPFSDGCDGSANCCSRLLPLHAVAPSQRVAFRGSASDLQVQSTSLPSLPFVNPNSLTGCKFVQIREN